MVSAMRRLLSKKRMALVGALLATLAVAGYGASNGFDGWAKADPDDAPASTPAKAASGKAVTQACTTAVLGTLRDVASRVYNEGVSSERTASATVFIERSAGLRRAVEHDDRQAARAAAKALLATGHMTAIEVTSNGRTLVAAGTPGSLAPVHGSIAGAGGLPIASFVTSVWSYAGYIDETNGIAEARTLLRRGGHDLAGSFPLPSRTPLADQGDLEVNGTDYAYTSFPGASYPDGRPLRVYLFRSLPSIAPLCGADATATVDATLARIARLIYTSEGGPRAREQVRRVQHNRALLDAVAARDPEATRSAIDTLLNEHIVRMRVSAGGRLLADVGGPYVLAPVHAPLRLHGRQIGSVVLSVQDDEGYKRLTGRLAGLDVLMYMNGRLVKNSLGPEPGAVPASGPYAYRSRRFQVYTFDAQAFPSGPLRVAVLIPDPYTAG
ncbi:MAG TPA: hypothetical protein VMG80_05715 [Solirubrobacteraceae bacterium]|nr:hypothetical protein [Solirubrobacteraceae bacterium]